MFEKSSEICQSRKKKDNASGEKRNDLLLTQEHENDEIEQSKEHLDVVIQRNPSYCYPPQNNSNDQEVSLGMIQYFNNDENTQHWNYPLYSPYYPPQNYYANVPSCDLEAK